MASDEFATMIKECMPHLRAYAYSLVRDHNAMEDLVQETLLRAWTYRARFIKGTNFRAWAFTILRNRFLDQHRRTRSAEDALSEAGETQLGSPPSQEDAVYFGEIANAYSRLSPSHREMLMLVGAMGFDYADAARVTGCPIGTVRSRLSRARTELRATLDGGARQPGRRRSDKGAAGRLRGLLAA